MQEIGVSSVPDTARQSLLPGMVTRPLHESTLSMGLDVVWRSDRELPLLPALLRLLRQHLRSGAQPQAPAFSQIPGRARSDHQGRA
ncbi:hypothetical protein [Deinococcus sp.]|uniref:hypothetical protein n=1 Tax=Deinococcus sp. TaxID=47478 RepID=UPI003C7AEFB7